jgi:putative flippase GtrA
MKLDNRFIAFVLVGGLAAAVNVVSRVALSMVLNYDLSIVIAYLVGMTTAYLLNRYYVFERSGRTVASEYVRFGLVNAVALVQVWLVSVILARHLFPAVGFNWHAELIAHGIGVASPIVTSYFGHKYFSFAPDKSQAR